MPSPRAIRNACLGLFGTSLLLHAVLACFAHPMADDFSYAHKDLSLGIWHAAVWEYQHWNGRFISNFLVLLGPLRTGLDDLLPYRTIPVILLAITLLAQHVFVRAWIARLGLSLNAFPLALCWCALYLAMMPDIAEGFYWYTGAVTYQPASALVLVLLAMLLVPTTPLRNALIALLAFACTGFHEVMMLLLVIGALAWILWQRRQKATVPASGIMAMAAVIAGAALMGLAPGNAGRSLHYPEQHQLMHALGMSVLQAARFGATWVLSPPLLLASLAFLLARRRILPLLEPVTAAWRPAATLAVLPVMIFLCVFPAYWSTGLLGQHRTVNVACFFFIPLWFLNLAVCLRTWSPRLPVITDERRLAPLLVLLGLSTLLTGNGLASTIDLVSGRAGRSSKQLDERYELLRQARGREEHTVVLPLIEDPPKSIYVLDIGPDPEFLQNQDYALWFGLKGRRIVPGDRAISHPDPIQDSL